MKKFLMKTRPLSTVVSATALLVGCLASPSQAQVSPAVRDWDCTISGTARGIAQLTFNLDGTITGQTHLQTLKKLPGSTDNDPRSQSNRTGEPNASPTEVINFFGSATIDGRWSTTESGRLIGFIHEGSYVIQSSTTNASTNSVSFTGVVRGGTAPRLTLQGTSPLGRQIFVGIPLQTLVDISGLYSATGKRGPSPVVEFFTLESLGMNVYHVEGSAPAFSYSGEAILSGHRRLSMATTGGPGNVTEAMGSFDAVRHRGVLHGRDSLGPVSFHVFQ